MKWCEVNGRFAAHLPNVRRDRLFIRLTILGCLMILFYTLEFLSLRSLFRGNVIAILGPLGYSTAPIDLDGKPYLVSEDGFVFAVTTACTYIDLIFIGWTFFWRFKKPVFDNVIRLAVIVLVLYAVNVVRVTFAFYAKHLGASWEYVHDLPDMAIHAGIVLVGLFLALWNDGVP
jgi:exosortase/archaeosortase family protein